MDSDQKVENNLLRKFEDIHDFIYANDGLSPQQTLNEFLKILFIKILDENQQLHLFNISNQEFAQLNSEIQDFVFARNIHQLFEYTKTEYAEIFDLDEKIRLSIASLGYVVNKLQNISLNESSTDAKGLAFQKFMSHKEKEGKGQFFTPEPVIDFCVRIIDPHSGESIIDPCCGSGGFIYSAYKYICEQEQGINKKQLIESGLFGMDINHDISKIAKMKFLLEENTPNNIFCHNSLDTIDNLWKIFSVRGNNLEEGFDVLLTNPPFGASGKITEKQILSQFNLGYKWENKNNVWSKTRNIAKGLPAEILFVERCLQLLREGGRMGIVLPNGHFENPSLEYLRYFIKQKAKILGIVNLPQETFIPYGTGVKTSLLFLQKETQNKDNKYSLFFGKVTKLGYQGNKNGTPLYLKDEKGNIIYNNEIPTLDEDFSSVAADYKLFIDKKEVNSKYSFIMDFNDLYGRFDYNFYSPENRDILYQLRKNSVQLGKIVDIIKKKSDKLKNPENTVDYIELSDINAHSFEIINTTEFQVHELPSRAHYEIKNGDIITAIAGNSVGTQKHATAFVDEEFDGAICTNGFRVLRNPKINPFYLLYYLHSEMFLKQMMMYRTGAAIPNVSDNDLANILVYIPDKKIMDEIGAKIERAIHLRKESAREIAAAYKM